MLNEQTIQLGWQDLGGTMTYRINCVRAAVSDPLVDFATVNLARFRLRDVDGVDTYQTAVILTDPAATATRISIHHVLDAADFAAVGTWYLYAQLSTDAGATWFESGATILKVEDPSPGG